MSDDLDDLLRHAMKTLDDQVPSGYFEALPNQTLSRLEASMQTSGTSGMKDPVVSAPVIPVTAREPGAPREEDSGLHDIRSLAKSTKQELRTKRITTNPPMGDDIAATSGAWKHVALPEPAKMVSLPSLDELPSKAEIRAFEKAAKASIAPSAATEAPIGKPAFSAWADRAPKKSRGGLYAVIGVGLAAAAGGVIFLQTQNSDKTAPVAAQSTVDTSRSAGATNAAAVKPAAAPMVEAAGSAAAETPPPVDPAVDKGVDQKATITTPSTTDVPSPKKSGGHTKTKSVSKVETKSDDATETKPVKPIETSKNTKGDKKSGAGKDGEPDFNDLLKEAGADGPKKVEKPKLEKKSLSEADFKKGIGAVAAKAAACYKGTQGNASVKLTIAPNGSVSKVSVGGMFAGKPEGDCVANAVKSASFVPWDGGPQTFSYAYLLSE